MLKMHRTIVSVRRLFLSSSSCARTAPRACCCSFFSARAASIAAFVARACSSPADCAGGWARAEAAAPPPPPPPTPPPLPRRSSLYCCNASLLESIISRFSRATASICVLRSCSIATASASWPPIAGFEGGGDCDGALAIAFSASLTSAAAFNAALSSGNSTYSHVPPSSSSSITLHPF